MRQIIYKEVKRPGKNHQRLIQMLKEDLHGPSHIRREYVKEVIAEAARFKRKALAFNVQNQILFIFPVKLRETGHGTSFVQTVIPVTINQTFLTTITTNFTPIFDVKIPDCGAT